MTTLHYQILSLILIAVVIGLEHRYLAIPLRRYELARWIIGLATILLGLLWLVPLGGLDWTSWLLFASASVIAGAVTGAGYLVRWVRGEISAERSWREIALLDRQLEEDLRGIGFKRN